MTLVNTMPFCGSCGWDLKENMNSDTFCDACGADLSRFGYLVVTGATAGSPGEFTPAEAGIPSTAVDVVTGVITVLADPQTTWTTNQYVECADLSICYWNGTAWAYGSAP